jgi:hypothetical protein
MADTNESHPPSPGHFLGTAAGLRVAYSMIVEEVDDLRRMDETERKSAEITTYALAMAMAAEQHGLPPMAAVENLVSCINDMRRAAGKPEVRLVGPFKAPHA